MGFRLLRRRVSDNKPMIGLVRLDKNEPHWADGAYWSLCSTGIKTTQVTLDLDETTVRREGNCYVGEFVCDGSRVQLRVEPIAGREDGFRRVLYWPLLLDGDPAALREFRRMLSSNTFFF